MTQLPDQYPRPEISGQPSAVRWRYDKLGPQVEVPLSIPPDHLWLQAHAAHLASLPEPPPIGVEVGHSDGDHFGSLLTITVPVWSEGPVTNPRRPVPEGVVVSPSKAWTTTEALDWLVDYLDRINTLAAELHRKLHIADAEAAAWWENRSD